MAKPKIYYGEGVWGCGAGGEVLRQFLSAILDDCEVRMTEEPERGGPPRYLVEKKMSDGTVAQMELSGCDPGSIEEDAVGNMRRAFSCAIGAIEHNMKQEGCPYDMSVIIKDHSFRKEVCDKITKAVSEIRSNVQKKVDDFLVELMEDRIRRSKPERSRKKNEKAIMPSLDSKIDLGTKEGK